ncbi:ABC transporter permease [Sulfolobus acidocaldarius]|uniref:ABC transporter permease n=1 Tax=Sulfolobus acidocaldarius TaxID=2285 RepID=UPI001E4237BA|nr:ABC transporter permease [Sulfolobus acidocaldarius]
MKDLKIKFILSFALFYGVAPVKRGTIYVVTYMITPLAELFLIYVVTRGALIGYAIMGGLVAIVAGNGISFLADFAFLRLETKIQDLLVATEVTPTEYILGLMLSNLIFSIPGIALYIVLAVLYRLVNILNILPIVLVLVLLLLTTSSIGFLIGSFIPHIRYSWGLGSILSILLTVLPPVFYPYFLIPKTAFYAIFPIPTTLGAMILQDLTGLIHLSSNVLYGSIALLIVETVIFYYLSRRFSRWVSA